MKHFLLTLLVLTVFSSVTNSCVKKPKYGKPKGTKSMPCPGKDCN
ncbi:MAG: hypothetical protein SNJ77_06880 [Cytophagales bacterium]